MLVNEITSGDVLAVLKPIWNTKRATARMVRERVAVVMKWAVAKGYRHDNPAGEALTAALPTNGYRTRHQKALPHAELGAALATVRASNATAYVRLAVEFAALTACRVSEVAGATWDEIDINARRWVIAAARMKAGREHRVPLSGRAVEILTAARRPSRGRIVFGRGGKPANPTSLGALLARLGVGTTTHGFRTSFRSWCADTGVDREVAEAALAHVNRNAVEAAYQRSDMCERRRAVMEAWADYLAG